MHHQAHKQMSEAFLTAAFLSISGGLQDAYTYLARGNVFANAQTGNIVLLSQHIANGDFASTIHYLVPLTFFALGVAAAEIIHQRYQMAQRIHWRQLVLVMEILLLFAVGFLPDSWNLIANSMVSFSCAMQVQAFRKVNSYAFASTMCIGNLRSGMESVCAYFKTRNKDVLIKAMHYFGVILLFAFGAGLGGHLLPRLGMRTIWLSCLLLLVSFLLMFIKEEMDEHPEIHQEEQNIVHDLKDIVKETEEVGRILENKK